MIGSTLTTVILAAADDCDLSSRLVTPGDLSDVFGAQRCISVLDHKIRATPYGGGRLEYILAAIMGVDAGELHRNPLRREPLPYNPTRSRPSLPIIDREYLSLVAPGNSTLAVFQAAALRPDVTTGDLVDVFGLRRSLAALRWMLVERPPTDYDGPFSRFATCDSRALDPARPKLAELEQGIAGALPPLHAVAATIVECDRLLTLGKVRP